MAEVEWKKIQYNNNYSINRNGDVRNDKTSRIIKQFRHNEGYTLVTLCKKNKTNYLLHRLLATAFIENDDPLRKYEIDHKNGIRCDNSLDNLRWCNRSDNSFNKQKSQGKTSKYKGVSYYRNYGNWESRVTLNREKIHLGYYDTEEEAALAYNNKMISLGKIEFAILNEVNENGLIRVL